MNIYYILDFVDFYTIGERFNFSSSLLNMLYLEDKIRIFNIFRDYFNKSYNKIDKEEIMKKIIKIYELFQSKGDNNDEIENLIEEINVI